MILGVEAWGGEGTSTWVPVGLVDPNFAITSPGGIIGSDGLLFQGLSGTSVGLLEKPGIRGAGHSKQATSTEERASEPEGSHAACRGVVRAYNKLLAGKGLVWIRTAPALCLGHRDRKEAQGGEQLDLRLEHTRAQLGYYGVGETYLTDKRQEIPKSPACPYQKGNACDT